MSAPACIQDLLTPKQLRKTERTADGHLLWRGARANGRPAVKHDGKTVYIKRLLWQELHGPIPPDCVVVSRCGQRLCIEPSHLALSAPGRYPSIRDNEGRYVVGEQAHREL